MKKKVLDVTHFKCPMTFLKTKEFIKVNTNYKKVIIIKGKRDLKLLSNSLKKNFELKIVEKNNDIFEIELM
jgi:TusA-related sulfurtransferase